MRSRNIFAAMLAALCLLTGSWAGTAAVAKAAGLPDGGELVVIDNVTVSPVFAEDACGLDGLSVPVTIVATFIPPPGEEPVGPYAVGMWNGGFGGSDMHFGTPQGKNTTQVFHVLLIPSGAEQGGTYTASVMVQDVGLNGGFAERDNIEVDINPDNPYRSPDSVKCPLIQKMEDESDYTEKLIEVYKEWFKIGRAGTAEEPEPSLVKSFMAYAEILEQALDTMAEHDPPDNAFQQIADPSPPPVLPPPTGLTAAQATAATALETLLAANIADARGMSTSIDRAWGAGNADSSYWYRRQLTALASFASRSATDLKRLPAAYEAMWEAIKSQVTPLPVTEDDVSDLLSTLVNGMPADFAATLTQLGASAQDEVDIAQTALDSQFTDPTSADASADMFAPPQDFNDLAGAVATLGTWASSTADDDPPVVSGLSATSAPSSGGTDLAVYGSNLAGVTGINFGPSTPDAGLGGNLNCEPTECDVVVPAGTGTVDVTASGPGGPSARTSADQLTYVAPTAPVVTRVFPSTGGTDGATSVTVFGSGLSDGSVYFGPTTAQNWTCTDTMCTAIAPPSGQADTVDVSVRDEAGASALVAADEFTYTTTPPTDNTPVVTGVSPASGSANGGDQVTITGSGFTDTSEVDFSGVQATNLLVVDDSHLTVTSPPGTGSADVTVVNGAGSSAVSAADKFSYLNNPPVVTAISPTSGPASGGTTVTITGKFLNGGDVRANDNGGNSTCTPTRCVFVTAPSATAGPFDVEVDTNTGDSQHTAADVFTYQPATPTIASVSPDSGTAAGGTMLMITGTDLGGASVTIGGKAADPVSDQGCGFTSCVVTTPAGNAGAAAVVVTGSDAVHSARASFSYEPAGPPEVTDVTPDSGWQLGVTTADVFGHNLTDGTVFFGSEQAFSPDGESPPCLADECTVSVPDGASTGTVNVKVTTPAGTSPATAASQFTYKLPTITSVSPSHGFVIGGTPMTITGTNLAGASINFDTASGTTNFTCTDSKCTGTTPSAANPGVTHITAESPDTQAVSTETTADEFTYDSLPPPTVTSVSPNSGTDHGGDRIVVTGTFLDGGTVAVNGDDDTFSSCTDTQCTAMTPNAFSDGTVDVTVTTATATSPVSAGDKFTYVPPGQPTITGLSISSGSEDGGTALSVTGTNLTGGSVDFGTNPATDVSCLATSCTAVTPAGSAGTVDVTVTTPGGTTATTAAGEFTYVAEAAPAVTSVSPAQGPASGGSTVTVTGTDLTNGVVRFGPTAAADSACGPDSCTATEPVLSPGAVDVTVNTAAGTSPASSADQFVVSPVTVGVVPIPGLADGDQAGGGQVTAAADGSTWFTMPTLDKIGEIAANGTITVFSTLDASSTAVGITTTPDGSIWYAEDVPDKIVALDPSTDRQTAFQVPGQTNDLRDVLAGPDGRIWFTLANSGTVGAMTTSGNISLYPVPDAGGFPLNLATGPDGRVWFTEATGRALGAVTMSGQVTEYPIPGDDGGEPWGLAAGLDGRMWFAEEQAHAIGSMSISGAATVYKLPDTEGSSVGITAGPDGRIWFTQTGVDQVSALDPGTGTITDFPLSGGYIGAGPKYMTMSRDGTLWVTENTGNSMMRVQGVATGVPPTVTGLAPAFGPAGGGTSVTITGTDLGGATGVKFGTVAATGVSVIDATHVRATAPPGSGDVDITVTTSAGTTSAAPADRYHYGSAPPAIPVVTGITPATGSTSGGGQVTVAGTGLTGGTVQFGATSAPASSCSATSCTATAPPGSGSVDVRVSTSGGTSLIGPADVFTYLTPAPAAPAVTGVSPASGPAAGGNTVTVTGTALAGGIVALGLNHTTATCTATSCTFTVPPAGTGTVDVRVITAGGTSPIIAADRYTYAANPVGVPGTPGRPTATAGDGKATVSWAAPASDGGSAITGYVLVPVKNGVAQKPLTLGTARTATVTGLTNGASYAFTVSARNAKGTGSASAPSAAVVPRERTAVTITSAPASARYGTTVSISGQVTKAGTSTGIGGVLVQLQYRPAGTSAFRDYGSAVRTSASGTLQAGIKVSSSIQVRLTVATAGALAGSSSAVKNVPCLRTISATLTPTAVKKGASAKLSGKVTPVTTGLLISLQRESGGKWVTVSTLKLSAAGSYRFTIKTTAKGTFAYRVVSAASTSFAATDSPVRKLKVT